MDICRARRLRLSRPREQTREDLIGLLTTHQVVRVLGSIKSRDNSFGGSFVLTILTVLILWLV